MTEPDALALCDEAYQQAFDVSEDADLWDRFEELVDLHWPEISRRLHDAEAELAELNDTQTCDECGKRLYDCSAHAMERINNEQIQKLEAEVEKLRRENERLKGDG